MIRFVAVAGLVFGFPLAPWLTCAAAAQDVTLSGMGDFRLIAPSGQPSHFDGGLGKFRWGDGRGSPVIPDLSQALLRASAVLSPDLRAVVEIRYDPRQKTVVDLVDAYLRYRPVSTSRWRWGVKAGAFFPPGSLENTNLGWTTEWTLTPSAINSWMGEELRILGAEATVEWRGDVDRFEFVAAAYGWNEPAGAAMNSYGWAFNDRPTGLFDHLRMPNIFSAPGTASYSYEFRQFDHSIGWYAGFTWERPDIGKVTFLRYDNEGDPNARDSTEIGWRTKFWSLSASTEIGPVVILSQAMVGSTTIEPFAGFTSVTNFWSYYVLAGIERGDWRYAVRFDHFATDETTPMPGPKADEHGIAGTAAVTWTWRKGVSVTGEVMAIDYLRAQRVLTGKSPHVTELQAQLALRLSF